MPNVTPVQTASPLVIRPYMADDQTMVLNLVRLALGEGGGVHNSEAFWHWKHHDNPFGTSYGLLAWDEAQAQLAGLRILLRWQFSDEGGQTVTAVRAVDTATHPDYRRQGIFSKLTTQAITELTAENVHLIFNTPNQKSLPGYIKMGWQIVDRRPLYLKVLRPLRFISRLLRRPAEAAPLPAFEQFFAPSVLRWSELMEKYGTAVADLVAHWEQHRPASGFRTKRTSAYLAWRYGQHPHLSYGFYPFVEDNQLVGLAILRPNIRYGLREAVLAELFMTDARVGHPLLKMLKTQLRADYLIAHFRYNSPEHKLLRQARFLRIPRQGITFTARPLIIEPAKVLGADMWDLTLGDLELF